MWTIYFEEIDPHGSVCMRGRVGEKGGYSSLPQANAIAQAHMEVEKRDGPNDGPRLLSEVRLSSGGVKIVVSDQGDADCKITACVSDQHVESDVCCGTEKLSWPSG